MLTLLDLLNRLLGYFNIQDKAKGRAFTIVAFAANFYLLVVAIMNLRYANYRIYGIVFLISFLVLFYFIVINFIYYFTDKQVPWDISRKVEKLLGGDKAHLKETENQLKHQAPLGASNGLFASDKLLPATVSISPAQRENLTALVDTLVQQGSLSLNYQGLDDAMILRVAQETKQPVQALGSGFELPFFDLQARDSTLVVLGGLNALQVSELATVERVGLMPVAAAQKDFSLALAHVFLTGGEEKQLGRRGLITKRSPYKLVVQLAYTAKNE
ncbi:DUF6681 family protein [Lacticaseibacillus mingshuiensis]|uniref:DUF6681 family protein n=1 Tax=Lacticaseibacillus mingshuiensis TaxID=2799574 RepID=UPI00194F6D10|nr:DUF6681 family protein [Lacticaseibacillus mingshuiensis]